MTPADYIAENKTRRAVLEAPYNPTTGLGSPLERVAVAWNEHVTLHLPLAMFDDEVIGAGLRRCVERGHSIEAECKLSGVLLSDEFTKAFADRRYLYDFEFWCVDRAEIKDKEGSTVRFVLNRPQRKYLARLEAQRLAGLPIRQLVLKHRQWGCTTMSYTYIAWHQMMLHSGRDAWFVGLDQDGARDVIERYDVIRKVAGLTFRNYGGSDKTKQLVERDCYVAAGSVERPNAPSGRAAQFVHLFEVGKWPSNPAVSAEKVAQNVGAMLPDKPGTIRIIESTAQASTGTYFMEICQKAQNGELADDFLFVSWLDDPQYVKELPNIAEHSECSEFVSSWTDYDRMLWDLGATLEQINWYTHQRRKSEYSDTWRLMEEFPTTADEAFQHGGKRIFPAPYVQSARKTCREPLLVGDLVADGQTGRAAFENIRFEVNPQGALEIWRMPEDSFGGKLDFKRNTYSNLTVGASDIGGRWEGADFSVTTILHRGPLLWSGMPEVVAEWRGHIDKDLFAWESARLAYWYHRAYWAIEVNSLREDNETDYDSSEAVLQQIMAFYPHLYLREKTDAITQAVKMEPGWWMNKKSKSDVIVALNKALREFHLHATEEKETIEGYLERSYGACAEMDLYMQHDDGSMGATSRSERSSKTKKDDRVITRAIALFLSQQKMPLPAATRKVKEPKRRAVGMAAFN